MSTLNIGLIGSGAIGKTHMNRINRHLKGGEVTACADPAGAFGLSVAADYGIRGYADPMALIEDPSIDAIINTTADRFHETYNLAAIAAGKYIFCEKPLAPTAEACKRIVDAEMAVGRQLVQVGFMRRFDPGYMQLKAAIDSQQYGVPLLLHCAHRNPSVPDDYDTPMAVENSMIHEIDVLRWLLGEDYVTAEVRFARQVRRAGDHLRDPQVMILTTRSGIRIDVEAFVNNGNNYEIKCEVVCEDAVLNLPEPANIEITAAAMKGHPIHRDWSTRFVEAYNREFQVWIDGCLAGRVDGPTAWDGYVGQLTAAAASKARDTQSIVQIQAVEMPAFYKR